MELSREHPGNRTYVRAVGEDGIRVGEEVYQSSIILSPDSVNPRWGVDNFSELTEDSLKPLLQLEPELVIIGTGKKQHFPKPELLMVFYQAGIGVEIMNTQAACRTFNILVLEERKVVAGLISAEAD